MKKRRPRLLTTRRESRQPSPSAVEGLRLDMRAIALRQLSAALVLTGLGWLAWEAMVELDPQRIVAALGSVSPVQWLLGAIFTAVSFSALGHYDAVAHRLAATGVSRRDAVCSGASAIALAQALGMGTLTGAMVRWRSLPGLGPGAALRVSVLVSLSFLAAWAVLAAVAVWLLPKPPPGAPAISALILAAGIATVALSLLRPQWLPFSLPPLRATGAIFALTTVDILAAGTVLWVLLPTETDLAPLPLLAAYLLALGAGLVLTTPGGIGPFEIALLALLPGLPAEPVLAAVLAYRALYQAVPAVLAGGALLRGMFLAGRSGAGHRPRPRPAAHRAPGFVSLPPARAIPFAIEAAIDAAPRAESALLRHGRLGLLTNSSGRPALMAAPAGQCLICLSDPLSARDATTSLLQIVRREADNRFLTPVLYKAGPRLAASARRAGWRVFAIADEAWLDPAGFSCDGPARRQLRRKLRQATSAGIRVFDASEDARLPLDEMAEVARAWAASHSGERGFSMGVWDSATLAAARIFLARDEHRRLVGFITVHANCHEHALDLMRALPGAPDGVMQSLVVAAIESAAAAGLRRFSLAAVPRQPAPDEAAGIAALRRLTARRSGAEGLRQFKSSFGPRWETRYLAAPSHIGLVLGGIEIAREINRPNQRRCDAPARRHHRPRASSRESDLRRTRFHGRKRATPQI